jgi:hypothetical protein
MVDADTTTGYYTQTYGDICGNSRSSTSLIKLNEIYGNILNATGNSTSTGSLDTLKRTLSGLSGNLSSEATYLSMHNEITNKYKDIVKNRRELDTNLNELYEIGDTTNNFYQKKLISTSYTKILLMILATSLTVAAFMTMRNK